jgi:hypothetical protein
MMKKMALVMLGMFLLGNVGFAGGGKFDGKHKKMDPEQGNRWAALKQDRTEFFKNLEALIEKYNKALEQDKEAVRNEIAAIISSQHDKDIAAKKEMLEAKKEMAAKMEAAISQMEKDKAAFVNKKVDFWVSEEGQEKIQKMQSKGMRDCKKDMKECKKCKEDCCKKDKKNCKCKKDMKDCSKKGKSKKKSK